VKRKFEISQISFSSLIHTLINIAVSDDFRYNILFVIIVGLTFLIYDSS